jgi:hypothetical protein
MSAIYRVTLLAPGDDRSSVRAFRAFLKFVPRHYGMRALDAREMRQVKHPARRRRSTRGCEAKRRHETKIMDMKQYAGSQFLKLKDVEAGPIRATIAEVVLGKCGKPDVVFTDGSRLSANATNTRALNRAFGDQSEDWIGGEVVLVSGEIAYQGEMKPSIIVNPIPRAKDAEEEPAASRADMDDSIPF